MTVKSNNYDWDASDNIVDDGVKTLCLPGQWKLCKKSYA